MPSAYTFGLWTWYDQEGRVFFLPDKDIGKINECESLSWARHVNITAQKVKYSGKRFSIYTRIFKISWVYNDSCTVNSLLTYIRSFSPHLNDHMPIMFLTKTSHFSCSVSDRASKFSHAAGHAEQRSAQGALPWDQHHHCPWISFWIHAESTLATNLMQTWMTFSPGVDFRMRFRKKQWTYLRFYNSEDCFHIENFSYPLLACARVRKLFTMLFKYPSLKGQ